MKVHRFNEFNKQSAVLYHGTRKRFDKFELGKKVSNQTYGGDDELDNGLGIFFTDNLTMAKWFAGMVEYDGDKYAKRKGGHVIEARVTINKPYMIEAKGDDVEYGDDGVQEYFRQIKKAGGVAAFKKQLDKEGYDGVIVKGNNTNYYESGTYDVWVAFSPDQIEILK